MSKDEESLEEPTRPGIPLARISPAEVQRDGTAWARLHSWTCFPSSASAAPGQKPPLLPFAKSQLDPRRYCSPPLQTRSFAMRRCFDATQKLRAHGAVSHAARLCRCVASLCTMALPCCVVRTRVTVTWAFAPAGSWRTSVPWSLDALQPKS